MKVRPYSNRFGKWKDGGVPKDDESQPVKPDKPVKPSAKNKWYIGKDGLIHVVSIGKFFKQTPVATFKEGEGTREDDAHLAAATEDQEIAPR